MALHHSIARIPICVFFISIILLLQTANSTDEEVKQSLIVFFQRLSNDIQPSILNFGWNDSSDPCSHGWYGIECKKGSVKRVILNNLGLNGILDVDSICKVQTLSFLSIEKNNLHGEISGDIANCRELTHLYANNNQFSGGIPASLSSLNNLKRLDVSNNDFSGELPAFSKLSGLKTFYGQSNQFSGRIPEFNFENLDYFNISFNQLSGPIPELASRFFKISSFIGNLKLCGKPLSNPCPEKRLKIRPWEKVLMLLGYIILGTILIAVVLFMFICKKTDPKKTEGENEEARDTRTKSSSVSSDYKAEASKSDYSVPFSTEIAMISTSLIVPRNSAMKDLRFEDLLKAPAELLGRGKFSSTYKVIFEGRVDLAVKRIKDWAMSSEEFQSRMEKIDQVNHPSILPLLAFYSSKDEKLVVYEYQQNGSLLKLLNGAQSGQLFEWSSRLSVAACLAQGLAYIHKGLYKEGIAHGNLKSSNILMDKNMDPCISEYGLMVVDSEPPPSVGQSIGSKTMDQGKDRLEHLFKADIYNFGVILLELLTGKPVQNNGVDLTRWVHSVVREEWTAEVFDRALFMEGASEERMVNLLQTALKCINPSAEARPSMNQVAGIISNIREEEERSLVSEV